MAVFVRQWFSPKKKKNVSLLLMGSWMLQQEGQSDFVCEGMKSHKSHTSSGPKIVGLRTKAHLGTLWRSGQAKVTAHISHLCWLVNFNCVLEKKKLLCRIFILNQIMNIPAGKGRKVSTAQYANLQPYTPTPFPSKSVLYGRNLHIGTWLALIFYDVIVLALLQWDDQLFFL